MKKGVPLARDTPIVATFRYKVASAAARALRMKPEDSPTFKVSY